MTVSTASRDKNANDLASTVSTATRQQLSNPSRNGLGVVRLALAILVLITHGFAVGGYGGDPLERFSAGTISLGSFAVHGFFVISGYLVSQSWHRLQDMTGYFIRRTLRLLPGYWVCIVVTILMFAPVMWWAQHGSLSGYWVAEPSPWGYLWRNLGLMQWQRTIGSLANDQGVPGYLNLSLWTLPHEFACYVALMFVAYFGGIGRRSLWPIGLFVVFYLNSVLDPTHARWLGLLYSTPSVVSLPMYFVAGVVWWSWADDTEVPFLVWATLVVAAMVAVSFGLYHSVMPLFLAAIILPLSARFRTPQFLMNKDYSFGIYLYGTPVERVLVALQFTPTSAWEFSLIALVVACPFAILSWHLCEAPSLKLGRRK